MFPYLGRAKAIVAISQKQRSAIKVTGLRTMDAISDNMDKKGWMYDTKVWIFLYWIWFMCSSAPWKVVVEVKR